MAKQFVVKMGKAHYVKSYQRTKGGTFAQYTVLLATDLRSEAVEMSWNQARTVAERNGGSISAA